MNFLAVSLWVFSGAATVSLLLALVRLFRGPSAADRFVALDLIGLIAVTLFAGHAIAYRENHSIDIVFTFSLVLFFGTVAFANLLNQGKHHD